MVPIIIIIVVISTTFGIWAFMTNVRRNYINEQTTSMKSEIEISLNNELLNQLDLIDLLCEAWTSTDNESLVYSYERYNETIPYYYNFSGELKALNWIDYNGTVRYVYPYEENKNVINKSIIILASGDLNTAFLEANSTKNRTNTNLIEFYQGGYGIASYFPIIVDDNITGFFNAVFDLNKTFNSIFIETIKIHGISDYAFHIYEDESEIFHFGSDFSDTDSFTVKNNITLLDIELSITIIPDERIREQGSFLSNITILWLGIFSALVAGILSFQLSSQMSKIERISEEKRKMESFLNIKQKLESLGRLAGGISHDFNNILAGLKGNIELIKINLVEVKNKHISGVNDDFKNLIMENFEIITDIDSLIDRSTNIIRKITLASRDSAEQKTIIPINSLIQDTIKAFSVLIDKQIVLDMNLAPESPLVFGNKESLFQALTNLLINANDAVENKKGLIKIETKVIEKEKTSKSFKKDLNLRDFILNKQKELRIQVIDNGIGISEQNLTKIFDPFFTTKRQNKGTGLGLTVVYNVISSIKGVIEVTSKEQEGTTFSIYLPIYEEQNQNDLYRIKENFERSLYSLEEKPLYSPIMKDMLDGLDILIVEDEKMIIKILKNHIIKYKGQCTSVEDGESAVEIYKNRKEDYDCIILDINLPKLNGIEVYKIIKKINPSQPIMFMTGYSKHELPEKDDFDLEVLFKPFSLEELHERLLNLKN